MKSQHVERLVFLSFGFVLGVLFGGDWFEPGPNAIFPLSLSETEMPFAALNAGFLGGYDP